MRLDHLLSTEFSGRRLGVRRVAHASGMVPGFAWACWCGRDHGLSDSFRGSGEWYGYAFGLPDRHPRLVVACGFRMPLVGRRGPVGLWVGSCRGAWWFENWIVDASNAMNSFHRLLYRDFARLFFGVWFRDRSFCDHFLQCDDLSSGVESYYQVFRGVCRPEGRMVDALADSTDEGRLRMR